MEQAQADETKWFDNMVIDEFEKKIKEQQAILHQVQGIILIMMKKMNSLSCMKSQASVPGFIISTDPIEIKRQARILELILLLARQDPKQVKNLI